MTQDYESLLTLTLELEGLISLRINRANTNDDTNCSRLDEMIESRIAALGLMSGSSSLSPAAPEISASDTFTTPAIDEVAGLAVVVTEEHVPSDEPVPEISATEDEAEEIASIAIAEETADAVVDAHEADTDSEAIATNAMAEETADADEPVAVVGEQTPATSVNDLLERERAANLRKAFSLNDRFRFRRALFRDSQQEMDEAIEALSLMTSSEEAEEYIYDDLCLDPDDEDVKAFMDIIEKHF